MKRRNFLKSSAGAGITGAAMINELFMNQLYGRDKGKSRVEDSIKDNNKRLSFLNKPYPVITALIGEPTPEKLTETVKKSETDGAQGIAISLDELKPEFRDSDSLKRIINSVNLPFMFLYYRAGKWGKSNDDERQELLLKAADAGASMIDVMGDLYDPSPMEITHNQSAIDKQKRLIDKIHSKGSDVVISSHMTCSRTTEEVVEHLRAFENRGPDVVKIVTVVNTEAELAEAISTTMTLRHELKKPFIHLCNGNFGRPYRFICPTLGVSIFFALPHHPENEGKTIPTIRELKTVLENIHWNINDIKPTERV
jgi:3-dehydroquinate dehydratase